MGVGGVGRDASDRCRRFLPEATSAARDPTPALPARGRGEDHPAASGFAPEKIIYPRPLRPGAYSLHPRPPKRANRSFRLRVGLGGPWGRGVTSLVPKGGRNSDAPGPYTRASGGRSASAVRRRLAWDLPPGDPATKHPRSIGTGRRSRRRGAPAAADGRLGPLIYRIQPARRPRAGSRPPRATSSLTTLRPRPAGCIGLAAVSSSVWSSPWGLQRVTQTRRAGRSLPFQDALSGAQSSSSVTSRTAPLSALVAMAA